MDLGTQIVLGVALGIGIALVLRALSRRGESPPAADAHLAVPPLGDVAPGPAPGSRSGMRGLFAALSFALAALGAGALWLYEEAPDAPLAPAPAPPPPLAADPPADAEPDAAPAEDPAPAPDTAASAGPEPCRRLARCCAVAGERDVLQGLCGSLATLRDTPAAASVCSQLFDAAPRLLAMRGGAPPECRPAAEPR